MNFLIVNKNNRLIFLDIYKQIPLLNIGVYHRIIEDLQLDNTILKIALGRGLYKYKIKNFNPNVTPLVNIIISNNLLHTIVQIFSYYIILIIKKIVKN